MILLISLALQATPVGPPPDAGRWVFRESRASAAYNNAVGISATLLAEDGGSLLAVRCDLSFDRTLSIQFLPLAATGLSPSVPVRLERLSPPFTFGLIWEHDPRGAFARDGADDGLATEAAQQIAYEPSRLRVTFADREGTPSQAEFVSAEGLDALERVLDTCPWPPPEPEG